MTTKKQPKKAPQKRASKKSASKNTQKPDFEIKSNIAKKVATKKAAKNNLRIKQTKNALDSSSQKVKKSATIKSKISMEKINNSKVVQKEIFSFDEKEENLLDPGFLSNQDVFDETDHAQWQQLREQAMIQHQAKQLNKPETHSDFDGIHCVSCDIEIPKARLNLQKIRCIDCQQDLENSNKRLGGGSRSQESGGWDRI